MLLLTNVISSRKYASKMFPSVRLEGLEQQCTAIPSHFNEKCEGIDCIWVGMGGADHVEQSLSWTQNNTANSVMAHCKTRPIALKTGKKISYFKTF